MSLCAVRTAEPGRAGSSRAVSEVITGSSQRCPFQVNRPAKCSRPACRGDDISAGGEMLAPNIRRAEG
jgi:hypothetical protein